MGETTEKKVLSLSGKIALNVVKVGVLTVISGALLMTSKDMSKEILNQSKQVKNIVTTAIADAIENKRSA